MFLKLKAMAKKRKRERNKAKESRKTLSLCEYIYKDRRKRKAKAFLIEQCNAFHFRFSGIVLYNGSKNVNIKRRIVSFRKRIQYYTW